MRILVLSLLRLGDILLHKNILDSLRASYPGAKVDFLINETFSSVRDLMPEVSDWHLFPRETLQRFLVERDISPLAAYQQLGEFIDGLNACNYDLIYDATHNRLSVKLSTVLQAKQILGAQSAAVKANLWESYFNNQFSQTNLSRFHYAEILSQALGLQAQAVRPRNRTGVKNITFQVLTSDKKKNWGLNRFKFLIDELKAQHPAVRCQVICAPQEKQIVEKVFPADAYSVLALGLKEAKEFLQDSDLLVTGDTSIQHLAVQVGCPVISVFLGSADANKTAPFMHNSLVFQASSPCYPCKHSEDCSQRTHVCAETISERDVYQALHAFIERKPMSKENPSSQVFSTQVDSKGFYLKRLHSQARFLEKDFERAVWSFYLNQEWKQAIPGYGSSVYELLQEWMERHSLKDINLCISQLRLRVEAVENSMEKGKKLISSLSRICLRQSGINSEVTAILSEIQSWYQDTVMELPEIRDSFTKVHFALAKDLQNVFSVYGELKQALEEPLNLNMIRKNLLTNLVRSLSEKGDKNGRELRILS